MLVTIVAIPEQDDRVWKLSSQKIPHMTMLFLGEINDPDALSQIIRYVEHTSSIMHRFWMPVDRRGELEAPGRDTADVLFFEKTESTKWLADIRSNLLKNPDILKGYNSAPQFDGWVPHLTLGYSDSPAHDDEIDYPIYSVNFDRMAVWVDEFEGPEFVLPRQGNELEVSMASPVRDFISHYGVKGMKWGRRKTGGSGKSVKKTAFLKSANRLSDAELNKRIKRLETEKKYNQLNKKDVSEGRRFAQEVLSNAGRRVATTVVTGAALAGIKAALTQKFGADVAEAVTRRLK
jgi:2'-5' RNA ligase